jgi:two-component system response regulator
LEVSTILLVEDNEDDVALALRAFEKNKVLDEIIVARDGEEALAYLGCPRVLPGVVLLDLNLPKIGGLDVLRRIRADERTRRIPVVILTSSDEEGDIISSYDLGANSFVCKPISFSAFVEAIRQLSLYWLSINKTPRNP